MAKQPIFHSKFLANVFDKTLILSTLKDVNYPQKNINFTGRFLYHVY